MIRYLEYWELWRSFHTPINHCAMCLPTWNTPCCYYRVLYCTISSLYSTVLYYCLRISIDSFIDQRDTYFFIPLFFCHYSFYIRELYLFSCITTKGQLISKCLFCVFNSPKKRTKTRYHSSKVEFFRSFLGSIEDTSKRHFEIIWPLLIHPLLFYLYSIYLYIIPFIQLISMSI